MAKKQEWETTNDDSDITLDDDNGGFTQVAQTFTLGTVGNNLTFNLSQIKVKLKNTLSPTGTVTVRMQGVQPDGSPDGTDISTGTFDVATIGTTAIWKTVAMTSASLQASQQYALLIDTDGTTGVDGSNYLNWRYDTAGSSYSGGNKWTQQNDASSWTDSGSGDVAMFQIEGGSYDGTLCTLAEAVNKAGAGASAGSTEEVLVSDYVRQAEGFINSATRKNWVDTYPSLNDDVKFLLNQLASSLAAIDIITYDMTTGYDSRVEAESMINIYREEVNRALFFLLDKNVEKFMMDA